jgi:hypothetical protein
MTIAQWNQLRPGDYIRYIGNPEDLCKVHALGPDQDWSDTDTRNLPNHVPLISHQIWTDLHYPDITPYNPDECEDFERAAGHEHVTHPDDFDLPWPALPPPEYQRWKDQWNATRSPFVQGLSEEDQNELLQAYLAEQTQAWKTEWAAEVKRRKQ